MNIDNGNAIDLMRTATDVQDWNLKRDMVKNSPFVDINYIDRSGLIVQVLGADPLPPNSKFFGKRNVPEPKIESTPADNADGQDVSIWNIE